MHLTDALAAALVVAASGTFVWGELALRRADDARAFYCLFAGAALLWAAVQMARRGTRP
jgi:hypothetical protein